MIHRPTIANIRATVLYAIATRLHGTFSWPDDGCASLPWSYEIHVGWVGDWNDEDRKTPCDEFLANWISKDENIQAALDRMAERNRQNAELEQQWRKDHPEQAAKYDAAMVGMVACDGCGGPVPEALIHEGTGQCFCNLCLRRLGGRGPCQCGVIGVMEGDASFIDSDHTRHSRKACGKVS